MTRSAQVSKELVLLAACGLASDNVLASQVEATRKSSFDWSRFESLALGHGMGGLASARLSCVAPGAVPREIAQSLQQVLRNHAALQMTQTVEAVSLTERFAEAGIESIVLKGVAVSHVLYAPNPHWRSASDIDILIDARNLVEADRVLRGSGYRRTWPEQDFPKKGLDMFLLLANAFNYISPSNGQLIELHHRTTLNPHWLPATFDQLYASSAEIETHSGLLRGLDGTFLLAYLCWHALGHIGYRLKWFCDIHLALARMPEPDDSEAMRQTSRPIEIARDVLAVLVAALGEEACNKRDVRWSRDVLRIVRDMENVSDMATSRSFARLPEEFANQLFLMKLSPTMRARAYQLLRTASDPRDVYTLGLGRCAVPVYAAAGPFLAVKRFATTGLQEAKP